MDEPSPSVRDLARRLLALEASSQCDTDPRTHPAVRVCEKLRVSLIRFAGEDGFTSLLRRSLSLARAEVPLLSSIEVKPDCSMKGLEELAAQSSSGATEAGAAICTHLIALLVTFIGQPLTLRLVREAWPDAPLDERN